MTFLGVLIGRLIITVVIFFLTRFIWPGAPEWATGASERRIA